MNTMHTPGPWSFEYHEDKFCSADSRLIITEPLCTLATVNVRAFAPHMDEPIANARLIAAAPELLEALKAAVDAIWLSGDRFNDHKAAVTDKARAAIEKETK